MVRRLREPSSTEDEIVIGNYCDGIKYIMQIFIIENCRKI